MLMEEMEMKKELELKQIQNELFRLLSFFDELCKTFDLQYCLFGGSLLGAIRYQNIIPWDDDLDVAMPRPDYERMISSKKIKKYIKDKGLFLLSNSTCKKYHNEFGKLIDYTITVKPNNKPYEFIEKIGLFLDIFPIDNFLETKSLQEKCRATMFKSEKRRINVISCLKTQIPFKNRFMYLLKSLLWKTYYLVPLKTILKRINSIEGYEKCIFVSCNASFDYIGRCVPKGHFFPTNKKIKFGSNEYPVPNEYIEVAKMLYGDTFMTPPPIEKRVSNHEFSFFKN